MTIVMADSGYVEPYGKAEKITVTPKTAYALKMMKMAEMKGKAISVSKKD